MKAWIILEEEEIPYTVETPVEILHADTEWDALELYMREFGDIDLEPEKVHVKPIPGLDDKPITYENAKAAGFEYECNNIPLPPEDFLNGCECDICEGARKEKMGSAL